MYWGLEIKEPNTYESHAVSFGLRGCKVSGLRFSMGVGGLG